MTTIGFVVGTNGPHAEVSTSRTGACGACSERSACGVDGGPSRAEIVTADNPIGARPGDLVELHLATATAMRLTALVWILPLVGLVLGAVGGATLPGALGLHIGRDLGQDGAVLIGAGLGLAAAFALLRAVDRRAAGDRSLVPTIVKVVQDASCPTGP